MSNTFFLKVVVLINIIICFQISTNTILADYTEETFDMQITNPSLWQGEFGQLGFDSENSIKYSIFSKTIFWQTKEICFRRRQGDCCF